MKNRIDIVVLTALEIERTAVLKYMSNVKRVVNKRRIYYKGIISDSVKDLDVVLLSLPYMGNVNAATATSQAIDVWNPRYVILVGISGGFQKDDFFLGDVVVSEQIVYYELGKLKNDKTEERYQVLPSDNELLIHAKETFNEEWYTSIDTTRPESRVSIPKVHFGIVASGEKVIANDKFTDNFKQKWPKSLAVEMEAYGTALAAYQTESRPGFLMIKSVCDWANSNKNDNWQLYSANAAAAFLASMLRKVISSKFNWKPQRSQPQRKNGKEYSSRSKIQLCKHMLDDWHDLADYFDIPLNQRKRFIIGRECQGLWEWLEVRRKLDGIEQALKEIDREDLVDFLIEK